MGSSMVAIVCERISDEESKLTFVSFRKRRINLYFECETEFRQFG